MERYEFLLAFHSNYVPLPPFLRYSKILVESRPIEATPPLFGALVWGDPSEFHRDLWRQINRVPALSYGVIYVILRLVLMIQCRLVTDRLTDGHTTA